MRTDQPRRATCPAARRRGGTDGWYDCNNIHNDSPNNTGLVELPHATGTGMDAGKVRPDNFWCGRGNPGDANGCPEFPRDRGPRTRRPNYGATPTELCPYAERRGRRSWTARSTATTTRRRTTRAAGRRTGTAAGSCTTTAAPAPSTALLLDPATDQDGGQPVYADSLRSVAELGTAGYMDSKFGADGALYVQVYDGFFRAGPNAGIYRFDYTGGPDTPGANPTRDRARRQPGALLERRLGRRLLPLGLR